MHALMSGWGSISFANHLYYVCVCVCVCVCVDAGSVGAASASQDSFAAPSTARSVSYAVVVY